MARNGHSRRAASVDVGAPSKSKKDAHAEAAVIAAGEFPKQCVITNNTRSRLVFPLVDAIVEPFGGKSDPVTFNDADHLTRFVTDAQQLAELNGFDEGIVIEEVEEDAPSETNDASAAEQNQAKE